MKREREVAILTGSGADEYHRGEKISRQLICLLALLASIFWIGGCSQESVESPQAVAQSFLTDLRFQKHEDVEARIWPETLEKMQAELKSDEPSDLLAVTRVNSPFLVDRIHVQGEIPPEPSVGDPVELLLSFRDGREATMMLRWGGERWFVDLSLEGEEVLKELVVPRDAGESVPQDEMKEDE